MCLQRNPAVDEHTVADSRFYHSIGPFSVGAIAQHVGAELSSLTFRDRLIHDLAALDAADTCDLSHFSDRTFRQVAAGSRAGAVITTTKLGPLLPSGTCLLYVADPRLAFARTAQLFYPARAVEVGIHTTAVVDSQATLGQGCRIDAGAKVGRGAILGMRCHVESNAVIGESVTIGNDCMIGANTTIRNALIGSRVRIASNSSIGGEGFGFVKESRRLLRMAQLGRVIIADDVEIGNNSALDRGTIGDTVIGSGTVIDNLVQIGHNVHIGSNCVLAGQVGIAGSAKIGDNVMIGGRTAISDHVVVGSNARVAGASGVMRDVGEGEVVGGYPAIPIREWHRQTIGLTGLYSGRLKRPPHH
jgi:UDP-3-O-[3-hydroxymyristoyl] glucosamine N-acyltransferase